MSDSNSHLSRHVFVNSSGWLLMVVLLTVTGLFWLARSGTTSAVSAGERAEPFWMTAYFASWMHDAGTPYSNWGVMTSDDLDWSAFTHLIYFALPVGHDGLPGYSLDPVDRNNLNRDRIDEIVKAGEHHGRPVLISVGGAGNYDGFSSAIRPDNRQRFIETLVSMVEQYGFDGIDLDMEPIRRSDYRHYRALVMELQDRFSRVQTRRGERPLITIAALKGVRISGLYAGVQRYVDQINIMTYDMAQPWRGWQAWHNSALYSGNVRFRRWGREPSSVDQKVDEAIRGGIDPRKLGIGIDFYGYIWHGLHRLETWEGWPDSDFSIIERNGGVPYSELNSRFDLELAVWDEQAVVSYLNLDEPKTFVSFDNEEAVRAKVTYALDRGLGGVMLWELGGGFIANKQAGKRQPLLRAANETLYEYETKMPLP